MGWSYDFSNPSIFFGFIPPLNNHALSWEIFFRISRHCSVLPNSIYLAIIVTADQDHWSTVAIASLQNSIDHYHVTSALVGSASIPALHTETWRKSPYVFVYARQTIETTCMPYVRHLKFVNCFHIVLIDIVALLLRIHACICIIIVFPIFMYI